MTLLDLKMKKAELRNRMDLERKEGNLCIEPETFSEYNDVIRALRGAESKLLKPIVISIIIIAMLFIAGCYSIHGVGRDLSTWTRPYVDNANR